MKLTYQVVAGKYDQDERNTKYVWGFNTLEEAFDDVANKNLHTYPFCEIEVYGVAQDDKFIIDCKTPVFINRIPS